MNLSTKVIWIILLIDWFIFLILTIIALTDILPDNILKPYRLIIGLGLITASGLIRVLYREQKRNNNDGIL